MADRLDTAMVLAAGLGTRIRSMAPELPKPLVEVAGRALIDYAFDTLRDGGVSRAVVNVHHRADQLEEHLAGIETPQVLVSDEREALLETGGGIVKAMPLIGRDAFFSTNTDAILRGGSVPAARRLADAWTDEMDVLLLLTPLSSASGYAGSGDFSLAADGRIAGREEGEPLIFSGLQILRASLFDGAKVSPASTRLWWDKARAEGRMYGVLHDGAWMHVGDPQGHREAEERLAQGL